MLCVLHSATSDVGFCHFYCSLVLVATAVFADAVTIAFAVTVTALASVTVITVGGLVEESSPFMNQT